MPSDGPKSSHSDRPTLRLLCTTTPCDFDVRTDNASSVGYWVINHEMKSGHRTVQVQLLKGVERK